MGDLSSLSPSALKAAMNGGTEAWGQAASIKDTRYAEAYPKGYRRRRMCRCGCGKRSTHMGMAKGITLFSGCELSVRRWVRDPLNAIGQRARPTHEGGER